MSAAITQHLVFLYLLFGFLSCSNRDNRHRTHERLIFSSSSFLMEDGEEMDSYYKDRDKFSANYRNVEYIDDTIKVSTLHEINSCGNIIGDIAINGDTIILLTKHIDNYSCASSVYYQFDYLINNPKEKKYIIEY